MNEQTLDTEKTQHVNNFNEKIFNKTEFLAMIDNNIELYNEIISDYKEMFSSLYDKLCKVIKFSDYEQIQYCAHTIKGMSGNIRAEIVRKISEEIELLSKSKSNIEKIDILTKDLEIAYKESITFM